MLNALGLDDPPRVLGSVAACLLATGVIWRYVVRPPYKFFKRMERALGAVEKELRPNGGSSLRDAIDRVEQAEIDHGHRLEALEQWRHDTERGAA